MFCLALHLTIVFLKKKIIAFFQPKEKEANSNIILFMCGLKINDNTTSGFLKRWSLGTEKGVPQIPYC